MEQRIAHIEHRDAYPKGGGPAYHKDGRASFWEHWHIVEHRKPTLGNRTRNFYRETFFVRLPVDGCGVDGVEYGERNS